MKPTSLILPFPSARRVAFVRRQAAYISSLSPAAGFRHLDRQLRVQAAALERKGVDRAVVDRERRSLEDAIRVELLQFSSARGDIA